MERIKKICVLFVVLACVAPAMATVVATPNIAYADTVNPWAGWAFGQRAVGDIATTGLTVFGQHQYYSNAGWHPNTEAYDILKSWATGLGSWGGVYKFIQTPNTIGWTFRTDTVAGDISIAANGGQATVVRYTAETAGQYDISGVLFLDDSRYGAGAINATGLVLKNGSILGSGAITGYGESYSYANTLSLNAGDTIEFATYGHGGDILLDAAVTAIPEPATLVLLAGGLLALRKRK